MTPHHLNNPLLQNHVKFTECHFRKQTVQQRVKLIFCQPLVLGSLEIYKFKTYMIKPPESTKSKARNKISKCSYMHMTMKPKDQAFQYPLQNHTAKARQDRQFTQYLQKLFNNIIIIIMIDSQNPTYKAMSLAKQWQQTSIQSHCHG